MSKSCFHCHLPVPPDADFPIQYQGRHEAACCAGCQAVAQSIIQAGLGDYYQHRTATPEGVAEIEPDFLAQLKLYDQPEIQADFVHQHQDTGQTILEAALILEGITCSACIWLNEQHVKRLPGVVSIDINYSNHRARVRWNPEITSLSVILEAIAAIGYRAHPYDLARQENLQHKQRKTALNRLWVAGLSMMQVMMYAVPVYIAGEGVIQANYLWLLHWASFLLTLPVVVYSAWPFYQGSWRDFRARRVGMDVPVSIAVLTTFIASTYALLAQIEHGIYFDSVSMFVFLLLGGRYLESMARQRAGSATERLVKLTPAFCHVVPQWPARDIIEESTVARLAVGAVVMVKAGEHIPADGRVVEGVSSVDESLLTGESTPRSCTVGDELIAGSVNLESVVFLEVLRTGENTRLAGIVRLLDRALASKPRFAEMADRVAGYFVAVLLLFAALTFVWWWLHEPERALWVTVAVLVVSCPCALSLATPAALTAATGTLAQLGILSARARTLETLPRVTDIVFDKTGTLTFGVPQVSAVQLFTENEPLALLNALERQSEHPIAAALCAYAADLGSTPTYESLQVTNYVGQGLEGIDAQGRRFRIGSEAFVAELAGEVPPLLDDWPVTDTRVAVGGERQWLARYALGDRLRPEVFALMEALRSREIRLHLLSGDHADSVARVAQTLNIETWQAHATPEDKLAYVEALQKAQRCVLMVGDGVNDAPVLARADVSLAMGSGTDVAQTSADMVLVGGHIFALVSALEVARRTRLIIRENLFWALLYNVCALPLAAGGYLTPWLASLGMALSSLLVVGNALRLLKLPSNETHR